MENKERSVREWIELFDAGRFAYNTHTNQIDAGWYDWFCKDSALAGKTVKLGLKVKQIAASSKINQDTMYVWFKNNCPMRGPLYDDFRFSDRETQDVIYTITPKSGHTGKAEVWGRANGFEKAIVEGTWNDVLDYFFPARGVQRKIAAEKKARREARKFEHKQAAVAKKISDEEADARENARVMV